MKLNLLTPRSAPHMLFLVALVFSATVPQFGMNLPAPALPQIGHDLAADTGALQFVITLYLLGYALAVLLSGFAAQRWGARRLHLWGMTVFSLASLASMWADTLIMLLSLRFVQALCGCGITVLSRLLVQQHFPASRHLGIITVLALAVALSPSVAPLAGGLILDSWGWRAVFAVLAMLGGISVLLFWIAVPADIPHPNSQTSLKNTLQQALADAKDHTFFHYLLAISLVSMAQIAFVANSAVPLQKEMALTASQYGLLLGLVAVGFVAGTQISRRVAPRQGIARVVHLASLVAAGWGLAMVSAVAIWPISAWALAVPMLGIMVSVGMIVPASQTGLLAIPARNPGALASLFFFGQIALASIYGMLARIIDLTPWHLALMVALPCLLLGAMATMHKSPVPPHP